MSKLEINSFVAYKRKPSSDDFEFYPKPRDINKSGPRTSILLGDVPFPAGVPAPEDSFTALYGFKDALEEIQKHMRLAMSKDMSFIKVTCKIDVDEIIVGTTTHETLPRTRFLNLRRLSHDLQTLILDNVNELAAKEGKKKVFYETILEAGSRPDLICKVIRNEPMFKHVNAVVYLLPDGTRSGRQVITVFSDELEDVNVRGNPPFDIYLPKQVKQKKKAA